MSAKKADEPRFSKEQFLGSTRFNRDLVAAVLEDGTQYTMAEAEAAISAYLEREVQ